MKFRKPTTKDKVKGVIAFTKILLLGLVQINPERVEFAWCMIKETIRGGFEVSDDWRGEVD